MGNIATVLPVRRPTATLLIPCLNERSSLPRLLSEAVSCTRADTGVSWNILVADNGSTDGSVAYAEENGAGVVRVSERGYGAALDAGIRAANTDWVVYLDADGTYSPSDAIRLVHAALRGNGDLVLGSRLLGQISPGAMPFLHRRVGTPVLSFLIRRLYGIPVSDCNSGIRALRPSDYVVWNVNSRGMEFASALLVRAAQSGAQLIEVPVKLFPNPPGRVPHLKSWRDGMRHLLVILANAPGTFYWPGLALLVLSALTATISAWEGPMVISKGIKFFGPHTQALAIAIGFAGSSFLNLALVLYTQSHVNSPQPPRIARWLLALPEAILFWSLFLFGLLLTTGVSYVAYQWSARHYGELEFLRFTLGLLYYTIIPTSLALGLFQSHLVRRVRA